MFFKKDDNRVKVNTTQITTFVGVDTKVEGTIITKSSIRIDGVVVGGVCSEGSVIVSKSGQVQGNIIAENIVVAGVVDGNMQIKDKTNIEPTGEVYGDISTDKILIDEESVFQGKVNMNKDREADKKRRRIRVDESDEGYEALSEVKTVSSEEIKVSEEKVSEANNKVTEPQEAKKVVDEVKDTESAPKETPIDAENKAKESVDVENKGSNVKTQHPKTVRARSTRKNKE